MSNVSSSTPLSGLRVIDFTHVLAGPACSYFLSLLGADVIKVESVGRGDSMRGRGGTDKHRSARGMSTAYLTQGGGKRSIALDLANPEGMDIMMKLLETADIFVENHRPSLLKKLGLEYETVSAHNPKLIHCAMTGYGRHGPKEDAAAYDVNIQAACGLMTMTGEPGTGPTRTGAPIMDYGVAMAAGMAITTALYQRTQTGKGTFIDVSMLETGLTLMSSSITDYLATGNEPVQRGNAANSRSPASGSYPTKEGLVSLGINEEGQFRALADVLGYPEWKTDPRFKNRQVRAQNTEELETLLLHALSSRTALEWEEQMLPAGVPAARVRTLPEALNDPQISARSYLHTYKGETLNSVSVPTLPFIIGSSGSHTPPLPPAFRGEQTTEILTELGLDVDTIRTLIDQEIVETVS